jgi:hypothetical protein
MNDPETIGILVRCGGSRQSARNSEDAAPVCQAE